MRVQHIWGIKMLARSFSALPLRPTAARTLATASLSSHRSVKVSVSGGVELHALVPVEDAKDKTPVVCLPSAFGASAARLAGRERLWQPLVCVGGVREDFVKQFEALAASYALVGVDPRGYGQSRPPRRDFPAHYFERDADDVMRAVDQLGLDKVRCELGP
jgi:pimeloyl-ACP methyl ester carboxylesterase